MADFTVGAGDCFSGYFCSAIAEGKSPEEAIRVAIIAASLPTKREIDQLRIEAEYHV